MLKMKQKAIASIAKEIEEILKVANKKLVTDLSSAVLELGHKERQLELNIQFAQSEIADYKEE